MLQKPTAKIGGGTGQQTACQPKRRFGDGGKLPFVCARQRFWLAESCCLSAQDGGYGMGWQNATLDSSAQQQRRLNRTTSWAMNAPAPPTWKEIPSKDCPLHPIFPANEILPIQEEGSSIRSCATTIFSGTSAPTIPKETSPSG